MRDFTLQTYRQLLNALKQAGYVFMTYETYCEARAKHIEPAGRFVIMRHDVDSRAGNSLKTAQIEAELGVTASYYFRIVPQSNQPDIIRKIAALGHEIGYHYEDMAIANGDTEAAIKHFEKKLAYFRQFYPVRTICMHGAPTSRYDGRDLWKQYNYRDFGIIGEPYFDTDFSRVTYLTDTGRCWDGYKVSLRDKIPVYQDQWIREGLVFHTTFDIIDRLITNDARTMHDRLPEGLLITTHPQRWTNNKAQWLKELLTQRAKNIVKRILIVCSNA